MKIPILTLTTLAIASNAPAAIIGINFGTVEQAAATASYASTELGLTVTSWNYDGGPNGNDWSGNGTSFTADGASINIWHDAGGTWRNDTQAESSPLHGYLDDGTVGENYIHLTGLSAWLSSVGDSAYRVTLLRSTDSATGWDPVEVKIGDVTAETGWLGNGDPSGGAVTALPNIPGIDFGGASAPSTYETPVFTTDGNGIAFHYLNSGTAGNARGTVAGIIIESVPEPSVGLLAAIGSLALLHRRRK